MSVGRSGMGPASSIISLRISDLTNQIFLGGVSRVTLGGDKAFMFLRAHLGSRFCSVLRERTASINQKKFTKV